MESSDKGIIEAVSENDETGNIADVLRNSQEHNANRGTTVMSSGSGKSIGRRGGKKELDPLHMEIERLKQEEARKKKEEQLRNHLREMQQEEQRMSRHNSLKIQDIWLKIRRREKVEDLRKQIDVISQLHDRQVDRKDAIMQMLYRDLNESEEQYRIAFHTHNHHMDELMDLHRKQVQSLQEEFEQNFEIIKHEFQAERMEIIQQHGETMEEIKEIIGEMEKRARERDQEVQNRYLHNKEAIKSKYSEMLRFMILRMNDVIDKQEQLAKREAVQFVEVMEDKYKDYQEKRREDQQMSEEIQDQVSKIAEFEQHLKNWKAKWLNNLREFEERNERLQQERNALANHYKELKNKMLRFRESQRRRLTELVKMSTDAMKTLQERLEKSQRLLKLKELNRKLETERERVLPFEQSSELALTEEERQMLETEMLEDDASAVAAFHQTGGITDWEQLGKFYQKFNKVLLDKIALEQEKVHLLKDNQQLRRKLKQYLDGISVNEDVLNDKNPLLVVNNLSRAHYVQLQIAPREQELVVAGRGDQERQRAVMM